MAQVDGGEEGCSQTANKQHLPASLLIKALAQQCAESGKLLLREFPLYKDLEANVLQVLFDLLHQPLTGFADRLNREYLRKTDTQV